MHTVGSYCMNGLFVAVLFMSEEKHKAYRGNGTESLSGESDDTVAINRNRINERKSMRFIHTTP